MARPPSSSLRLIRSWFRASSAVYVDQIGLRLDDAHFRFPHKEIVYSHAGHNVGAKTRTWREMLKLVRTDAG